MIGCQSLIYHETILEEIKERTIFISLISKPFWTDCRTEGYSSENFGVAYWERSKDPISDLDRVKFYADKNCAKVSHILSHEILRMKGRIEKGLL